MLARYIHKTMLARYILIMICCIFNKARCSGSPATRKPRNPTGTGTTTGAVADIDSVEEIRIINNIINKFNKALNTVVNQISNQKENPLSNLYIRFFIGWFLEFSTVAYKTEESMKRKADEIIIALHTNPDNHDNDKYNENREYNLILREFEKIKTGLKTNCYTPIRFSQLEKLKPGTSDEELTFTITFTKQPFAYKCI